MQRSVTLIVLCLIIGPTVVRSAEPATREGDVLATLKPGHPRLVVLDTDLARLKQQIKSNPTAKGYFAQLQAAGDKSLVDPLSERKLIGPRLLHVSRQVLNRVATWGGLYRLTGDEKYAKRAREEMLAAAAFVDWNPSHFLDTAEMTNALAIGYDWILPTLSDADRATIRNAIVEKGLKPGLKVYESKAGWHTRTNNWNQVCNGGMTIGALAIADEEPQIARGIIEHGRKSIPLAMAQFAPDGGCIEGPGYWSYATYYTAFYLSAIQTALGTDFGFLKWPGFADTGMFRIHTIGPLGRSFNFADAGEGVGPASQMFYLARALDRPAYATHERARVQGGGGFDEFHLLWFNDAGGDQALKNLPTCAKFAGVEVATLRSAWNDPSAGFVGFKGGDNAASHANLDLGGFVYDADGVRWAYDLGPDDYNLPGYFGKERWNYYRMRTEGQNTLTINGANQNLKGKSKIVAFSAGSGGSDRKFAVADLSDAYKDQTTRVTRGVELIGRQLLVQDEVEAENGVDVVWHLHTQAKIEIVDGGKRATLRQGDKHLTAYLGGAGDARFEIAAADRPPDVEPNPPMRAKIARNPQKLIARCTGKSNKLLLSVMLVPGDEKPVQRRIVSLKDWK